MTTVTQLVLEPGRNAYALPEHVDSVAAVLVMSSESCRITNNRENGPTLDWSPLSHEPMSEVRRHQCGGPGGPVCWAVEDGHLHVAPSPDLPVTLELIG